MLQPILLTNSIYLNPNELQPWKAIWNDYITAKDGHYNLRSMCPWKISQTGAAQFVSLNSNRNKECIDWNHSTEQGGPEYIINSYCKEVLALNNCSGRPRQIASYMCVKRIGTDLYINGQNRSPVLQGRKQENPMPIQNGPTFDDDDISSLMSSAAPSTETRVADSHPTTIQSQLQLSESSEPSGVEYKIETIQARLVDEARKPTTLSNILKGMAPNTSSPDLQPNNNVQSNPDVSKSTQNSTSKTLTDVS